MADANWQKVREVFDAALQQKPEERQHYINEACGDDKDLLTEVESLFSSLDQSDEFLETPAVAHVADVIESRGKSLIAGTRFGHYEIIRQIGTGGMGEVYLAQDQKLDRQVAIKILNETFSQDESNLKRFVREAKAASALNHPNILVIHEIGESEAVHYIVSEFIEGKTLREVLTQSHTSWDEVLTIAIQIGSALSAAHGAHLVHRDIKPENVMLRPDGYVKVLDFGLAKLMQGRGDLEKGRWSEEEPTLDLSSRLPPSASPSLPVTGSPSVAGVIMGTVGYMSPEQAEGELVDERTDIFSFGVVLYEMLAGRAPFVGGTMSETFANLINAEPQQLSSSVPDELKRIVAKTLHKNKDGRYLTMKDVLTELKDLEVVAQLNRSPSTHGNGRGAVTKTGGQAVETAFKIVATGDVATARPSSSAESVVSMIKRHRRGALLATAAVVVAIVAYFSYPTSSSEAIDSVAVLPFVNVNGDPNTDYLSEGISDSIINSLSRLPNLTVRPLTSVLRYKGPKVDPQAVGRELNVRAVLIGRLSQQGDSLDISAKLVDVKDNHQLWEGNYRRNRSDILSIQDEIAREISEKLQPSLTHEDKKQVAKQYTENTDAWHFFSSGNYHFRQNTKEAFQRSIDAFEQAIKIDPNYALAYARLAGTYHFMGTRGFSTTKETEQRVESAALKALQLDETLAEGHALLGMNKYNNFDWVGAEKELKLKRALELEPNSSSSHFVYFGYMVGQGRVDEGLRFALRAHELDPTRARGEAAFAYFLARQYDKAIELYLKSLEKQPDNAHSHILLGEAYVAKGMSAEGVAEMQKGMALDATLAKSPERWDRYPLLAYAYAMAGRRDDALKILDQQLGLAKQGYVSPYNFAIIYTGLGDKDRAFEWLRKCVDQRTRPFWQFRGRPLFDPLRSDPRYADLLRRMNLEP